jgi:DNA-binding XRE family transcriptional regulator
MDWEAIFHGSERRINTVIIGTEADFRSRSRMSREEVAKLIRAPKEYVNLSYDSETTIAAEIGVSQEAMHGWISGKVKPRLESLLRIRVFLERRPEVRSGIAPIGYVPRPSANPNGRKGKAARGR